MGGKSVPLPWIRGIRDMFSTDARNRRLTYSPSLATVHALVLCVHATPVFITQFWKEKKR